jgi:hypothetical protein
VERTRLHDRTEVAPHIPSWLKNGLSCLKSGRVNERIAVLTRPLCSAAGVVHWYFRLSHRATFGVRCKQSKAKNQKSGL